jgi:UDP:flavonoid glycosyltransferase YjiC (YdhE family)
VGAGEFILPESNAKGEKSIDAGALRKTVREVLETPSYRENAERHGETLKSYGGIDKAADLIEDLARGRIGGG